eukprot:SAG22_NODE_11_length_35583_cov_107.128790_5_plen_100_part_00
MRRSTRLGSSAASASNRLANQSADATGDDRRRLRAQAQIADVSDLDVVGTIVLMPGSVYHAYVDAVVGAGTGWLRVAAYVQVPLVCSRMLPVAYRLRRL